MEKLLYICKWDKEKRKTWSGTPYSLRESLMKYFEIVDCDIQLGFFKRVIAKLLSYHIYKGKIVSHSYIFNRYYMNQLRKKAKKAIKKFDGKYVLEIGDFYTDQNHIYSVYQDLSVGYLLHLQKNFPETYSYCGHVYPRKVLEKRNKYQIKFYENCDNIFVMGKWLENFLKQDYEKKVHYVGAGYNAGNREQIEMPQKSRNKILFVGRDFERKGGDIVLEAYELAKVFKPDLQLYIAGPTDLACTHGKLREGGGVYFLGDVPNEKLGYYYNLCDVFCVPSRFEAFGIVFVEALHFGLPVIAANNFEMKEIVRDGENGLLLTSYNAEELSKLFLKIFDSEEIFAQAQKSEQLSKEYSWDVVAERMFKKITER